VTRDADQYWAAVVDFTDD